MAIMSLRASSVECSLIAEARLYTPPLSFRCESVARQEEPRFAQSAAQAQRPCLVSAAPTGLPSVVIPTPERGETGEILLAHRNRNGTTSVVPPQHNKDAALAAEVADVAGTHLCGGEPQLPQPTNAQRIMPLGQPYA